MSDEYAAGYRDGYADGVAAKRPQDVVGASEWPRRQRALDIGADLVAAAVRETTDGRSMYDLGKPLDYRVGPRGPFAGL